jgi:ribose transport system substrate-binding protein
MKKIMAVLLALALVVSMTACAAPAATPAETAAPAVTQAPAPAATVAPAVTEAPAKAVKEAKDIKIAIVSQNQGNPVFLDLEVGAKDKAKELGIQFEWTAPPNADAVAQAEMIESISNKGVDAIGVVPLNSTLNDPMKKASEKGIYMAAINGIDIFYPGLAFIAGTPQFDGGYESGKLALKYLTDKSKTYKIAMIEGQAGTETFTLRMDGFKKCLDENGVKYEVLGPYACNDDFALSGELVEQATNDNPDMDMWFFSGGWPFFLDPAAMPNFAKWENGVDHVCITFDSFPPMEVYFTQELCSGAVGQDYYRMGELVVEYLYKLVRGETLPPKDADFKGVDWYSTGVEIITPENYKEVFGKKRPW